MNTTATDAAIEELEQLVEIEEAGYRLVMTRHRQTYIGAEPGPWEAGYRLVMTRHRQTYIGAEPGPWEEIWHVRQGLRASAEWCMPQQGIQRSLVTPRLPGAARKRR